MKTQQVCNEFVPLVNGGNYRGTICCICGAKGSEHDAFAERDRLKAVNAELLEALDLMTQSYIGEFLPEHPVMIARAALAKARGQ